MTGFQKQTCMLTHAHTQHARATTKCTIHTQLWLPSRYGIMLQVAGTIGAIRSKMWCSSNTALKEKGEGPPLAEHMPFQAEPQGCQHVHRMRADHLGPVPLATPHQREASLLEPLPPTAREPEAHSTPYMGSGRSSCCSALLCSETMAQQGATGALKATGSSVPSTIGSGLPRTSFKGSTWRLAWQTLRMEDPGNICSSRERKI